jgi:tRNA(adenine34) deaminase
MIEEFNKDEIYMKQALRQAEEAKDLDEVPVGAVIVYENRIIAKAYNQVKMLKDPTAHAEMIAITQAANLLQNERLMDCDMYVTIEPCSMCAGALILARIRRLVFSVFDLKSGACGSVLNIANHPKLNHKIEVKQGILEKECVLLLQDFFKDKRI